MYSEFGQKGTTREATIKGICHACVLFELAVANQVRLMEGLWDDFLASVTFTQGDDDGVTFTV